MANDKNVRAMRLTHKHKYRTDNKRYVFDMKEYRNACQKLGQLENIEEELGIDLITLFKALTQFYAKDLDCYCPHPISLFKDVHNEWYIQWVGRYYKVKDYGKTWALTREELL